MSRSGDRRKARGRRARADRGPAGLADPVRQRRRCARFVERLLGRAAGSARSSLSPARWRSSCPQRLRAALRHGFRRRRFGQVRRNMPRTAPGRCAGSTAARARSSSAFERATAARADVSLFVSEAEAALFRRRTGLRRTSARCRTASTRLLRSRRRFPAPRPRARRRAADRLHRPDGLSRPMSTRCAGSRARCCR